LFLTIEICAMAFFFLALYVNTKHETN
jgi:hypothetical protein